MNTENGIFRAGYAREIITPPDGTPLGGYGNATGRRSVGKLYPDDDLFVTAIALSDASGKSAVIMTVDVVRIPATVTDSIRELVQKEIGTEGGNVIICATHSHSSPELLDNYEPINEWKEFLINASAKAAKEAFDDLRPATAEIGKKEVSGLNFVRRYMKDGEFLGTNAKGDAHETDADRELQLIRFKTDGAKDIVLVNFGAHCDHSKDTCSPEGTPGYHRGVSADYNYMMRKTVEEKAGVRFAFFQAAAGNLNPISTIEAENARIFGRMEKDGVKRYIAHGLEMADEVLLLLVTDLKKVNTGNIFADSRELVFGPPHSVPVGSPRYNEAKIVRAVSFGSDSKPFEVTPESREAAEKIAEKFGIASVEEARKIKDDPENENSGFAKVITALYDGEVIPQSGNTQEKSRQRIVWFLCSPKMYKMSGPHAANGVINHANSRGKIKEVRSKIYTVSFGDIAFAGAPCEMFDTNGKAIKEASPFAMTFVCEQSCGYLGYLPTLDACKNGGYEVDASNVEYGSAEIMENGFTELLKGLGEKYSLAD